MELGWQLKFAKRVFMRDRKEYQKKWYEKNKETHLKRATEYHTANKDFINKKKRDKYKALPEEEKEKVRKKKKQWEVQNRETFLLGKKAYRDTNRDKINLYFVQYRKDNPDKVAYHEANARARRFKLTPYLTKEQKLSIKNMFQLAKNFRKYTGENWHIDHIRPLSKGGLHTPNNLQVVPATWNLIKGNKNNQKFNMQEYFRKKIDTI